AKEPEAPAKPTYNFMIKKGGTHTITEEGLAFRTSNFGIHCSSQSLTFVELDVTKDGKTEKIKLQRSCTGLSGGQVQGESMIETDAFGYHFKLDKVLEPVAYDINSFEYHIKVN